MADLFQSEYDVGSLRRGVQDGETLWALLAEDGTVTVVADPTGAEQESAGAQLSKLVAEEPDKDAEKEAERQKKIAALSRTVNFQPPVAAQLPAEEDEEEEGNGRRRGAKAEEKAEARS